MQAVPTALLTGHQLAVRHLSAVAMRPGMTTPEHTHGFYEALVVLHGRGEYLTQDGVCPIGPGSVLLHPPAHPHSWRSHPQQPCLYLVLWFSIEPPVSVPGFCAAQPELLDEFSRLFKDVKDRLPGWHALVASRLLLLISRLLARAPWAEMANAVVAPACDLVTNAMQFLRDNLARPITLDQVADHLGISRRSLTRNFRESAGRSLMDQLTALRMDHAADLLTTTNLPLAAIGTLVGMPDPSYFCKCFRRHVGVTPHAYRMADREGQTAAPPAPTRKIPVEYRPHDK